MLFLGLSGNSQQGTLESAVIAVHGKNEVVVVAKRTHSAPVDLARQITDMQPGTGVQLDTLGPLHAALGWWVGEAALEALAEAKVAPQAVELAGCRVFEVSGGLTLGDLGLAGERSGLAIIVLPGTAGLDADATACARAAWEVWQGSRRYPLVESGGQSITEGRNPATMEIDRLSALDQLRLINREDSSVARAIGGQLPQLAEAVERITERMRRGGRLIYVGAGTSGRIGVLDASEMPPTYGTSRELVVGLIAGGDVAIRQSLEGVEDDQSAGAQAIADLRVSGYDSLVGIAASGRTPFVIGAMAEARRRGALTISLACNSPSPMEEQADIIIAPVVGPEVITGSTRMKAGTAQKMALNMISTAVMVRQGKTFSNLMVDMQTSNSKLQRRARRIVAQACGISEEEAGRALDQAGGEMKTAIVAVLAGISPAEARVRLAQSGGVVRRALEYAEEKHA